MYGHFIISRRYSHPTPVTTASIPRLRYNVLLQFEDEICSLRSNFRLYEVFFSVSDQISRIRGLFFSLRSNFRLYKACFSVSNQIFDYTRLVFQLAIKFRVYEVCFSVSDQTFVYTRLVTARSSWRSFPTVSSVL